MIGGTAWKIVITWFKHRSEALGENENGGMHTVLAVRVRASKELTAWWNAHSTVVHVRASR